MRENRGSPLGIPSRLTARRGWVITRVAAREKKKALGPCELKALLRDPVESMHEAQPSANHMAPPDLAVDDTSYVRR